MKWQRRFAAAAVVVALTAAWARAESCSLELKRLDARGGLMGPGFNYIFRATASQHFFMQLGKGIKRDDAPSQQFAKLVKKQPAKYHLEQPFRGVVKLGADEYPFVFDAQSAESKRYDRLYFDLNHNGDLTDDKPVDAEKQPSTVVLPANYWQAAFPRLDLTLNVDGKKVEYGVLIQLYSQSTKDFQYVSGSLSAGVYREGEITLEGKNRRVALIDFNSNGRFDDGIRFRDDTGASFDGDHLLVDPGKSQTGVYSPYDVTSSDDLHPVSKLVCIDGRFYEVDVTPAGDRLTLTPSAVPVGKVNNPGASFRALVSGSRGLVKISGKDSQPVLLPEGTWRVLSYTLERSDVTEPKKEPAQKPVDKPGEAKEKKSSLLQAMVKALAGGGSEAALPAALRSRFTRVSAQMPGDSKRFDVKKDQLTTLPLGPPYKPVVRAEGRRGAKEVNLSLALVGAGGETCSDMMVNGNRPGNPKFTIRDPNGNVVQSGEFEYG